MTGYDGEQVSSCSGVLSRHGVFARLWRNSEERRHLEWDVGLSAARRGVDIAWGLINVWFAMLHPVRLRRIAAVEMRCFWCYFQIISYTHKSPVWLSAWFFCVN